MITDNNPASDLCVVPSAVETVGEKIVTGLPTLYQQYIHKSRYARWRYEDNRRETWEETVDRYMKHFTGQFRLTDSEISLLTASIRDLHVMPSMRAMMTAGKAASKCNISLYNCAYMAVDHIAVFSEVFYILMSGTGVGYSVERQFISQLPELAPTLQEIDEVITVPDSREGWADSLAILIDMLYQGHVPTWDTSSVRPAGAPLKTFGGRASGPKPLEDMFNFIVETFAGYYTRGRLGQHGNKLNSLSCHDILCKIADGVIAGGVRRSALISLSNLSDNRMAKSKTGEWWNTNGQRALANNSVCYSEKPDFESFMAEWVNLYESKCGERGIFNRAAAEKKFEEIGRLWPESNEVGCNPCLHPDSMVETINGRVRIADIKEPTKVYTMLENGELGVADCSAAWLTKKDAEILKITTRSGHSVRCTKDHKIFVKDVGWLDAGDLKVGMPLVQLKRSRRGACYSGVSLTSDQTNRRHQQMEHRLVWESVNGKLPADWDVHHKDEDTYNNSIGNLEGLHHSAHSALTRHGCPNDHQITGKNAEGKQRFLPGNGGYKKPIVQMPDELKGNCQNQFSPCIVKIEEGGVSDVYDLTVEGTHNFIADFTVVHNCSEILLRNKQLCNLSEVIVRKDDTLQSLLHKVEIAAILGTLQATQTDFKFVRQSWIDNCKEEALLGVSLTGIMDHPVLSNVRDPKMEQWLSDMRSKAKHTNAEWAARLGINPSAAVTCTKPSGTVSQLTNTASGIHPRYSRHYIRTVRGSKADPITQFMSDQGVPVEDDVMNSSGAVFSFPIASDGTVFRDDMRALDQLKHWKVFNDIWCDHKPSITVYYRDDDFLACGQWLWENFDSVSGISFLPHSDHVYQQAPYQEITLEGYNEAASDMPTEIDWNLLANYEVDDMTTNSKTLACTGGSCEL